MVCFVCSGSNVISSCVVCVLGTLERGTSRVITIIGKALRGGSGSGLLSVAGGIVRERGGNFSM